MFFFIAGRFWLMSFFFGFFLDYFLNSIRLDGGLLGCGMVGCLVGCA